MMTFWIAAAIATVFGGLWIARPFLSRGSVELNSTEGAISVFRDQLDEVDRDLEQGLISPAEREAARREIELRTAKAARTMDGGLSVSRRSVPALVAIILVSVAVTLGGYLWLGALGESDAPLAARRTEALQQRAVAGDINSRISLLIERLADTPDSFEDWWVLATTQASIGDHAAAAESFRRAAELGGDRPGVLSAYAESITLANGNKVPNAARLIFEQVLAKGPDVRARYYLALAKAQAQNFEGALEDWARLAAESQPTAPWMQLVRRDIVNMARFAKADVTDYLPDATPEEIAQAGGALTPPDGGRDLDSLRASVAADPLDYDAWIDLAARLSEAGQSKEALAALDDARSHFAAAPFVLRKFDHAARALGLDLVAGNGVAGPSAEDIAAASQLSAQEQDDMIAGMVAGLAAKLEEAPGNLDGWIMLVRSYATMGDPEKAQDAYEQATQQFAENKAALDALSTQALPLLTE